LDGWDDVAAEELKLVLSAGADQSEVHGGEAEFGYGE
jgi:hypothetical protein